MTDKQIIIDEMIEEIGLDVSKCTYLEIEEDAPNYPEIGGTYTAFECNYYSRDCKFIDDCVYKKYLRKEQECETLASQLDFEVQKKECLEQECERLKKQIKYEFDETLLQYSNELDRLKAENEELKKNYFTVIQQRNVAEQQLDQLKAENEDLKEQLERADEDIKAKCTRCAMTNKLDEQIDQLKEQLEAYKMEAEEGKEINAELKAENDTYKKMFDDKEVQLALTEIRSGERHLWFNKAEKLKQTLTEIKEIAEKKVAYFPDGEIFARPEIEQILQICDEVKDGNI